MQQFVTAVWNLLLGPQVKFDMLISNAIQILASVADRQQYKELFEDPATLASAKFVCIYERQSTGLDNLAKEIRLIFLDAPKANVMENVGELNCYSAKIEEEVRKQMLWKT